MSKEYSNADPIKLAEQAERDLASTANQGNNKNASDSVQDSGIDESATQKFPGASVTTGSAASGAGDNRDMPEGGVNPNTGKPFKAGDFEGAGGPEDKARAMEEQRGGDDAIRGNIRQGGETIRPGNGRGAG